MAEITAVIASSHSPFLFQPTHWWKATRGNRRFAAGVPVDDVEENERKMARIDGAFARLREVFAEARPDVVVIFGDDQDEQFNLANHPAFAIYVGGDVGGYRAIGYTGPFSQKAWKPKTPENWTAIRTRPELARSLLRHAMDSGFDPAFMMELPNREIGIGHAFTRPLGRIDPGFDVPIVPVLVNCMYAPQPSAARCVAFARALAEQIRRWPDGLRVAVLGSGGLWHTPGAEDAYIDKAFDARVIAHLQAGEVDAAASFFDGWQPPEGKRQLRCYDVFAGGTGMPGGIGSGVGETRNWLMAAAVANTDASIIDYIPIHDSPIGAAFAWWDLKAGRRA